MRNGNLAYKFEEQVVVTEDERRIILMKRAREQRRKFVRCIKIIFSVILVTFSMFLMVSRGIEFEETKDKISSLEKQLATAESITCQKTFDLESEFDLKTIEEIATTKLGMQRPEKYQIVYLNINKEDSVEVTADEVEGVGNRVSNGFNEFCRNIVGIFSVSQY